MEQKRNPANDKGYFGIETELWNRIGSLEQKMNCIDKKRLNRKGTREKKLTLEC